VFDDLDDIAADRVWADLVGALDAAHSRGVLQHRPLIRLVARPAGRRWPPGCG